MKGKVLSLEEIAELELKTKEASSGAWRMGRETGEEYYGNFSRVEQEGKLVALLPDYGPEDRANLALLLQARDLLATLRAAMEVVVGVTELEEANYFTDFSDPAHPRCLCGGEGDVHDAECLVGRARRLAGYQVKLLRQPAGGG